MCPRFVNNSSILLFPSVPMNYYSTLAFTLEKNEVGHKISQ